jgi:hypothetical protein
MRRRLNYIAKLAIAVSVAGVPLFAQAACSADGYTVVFVNGINTSEVDATREETKLKNALGPTFNNQPLTTVLGYNQTHVAGLGDWAEVAFPALDQLDLDTILRQMHDEVHTRKLLIVGHSQGSSYANKIYDYLIAHGEPKDAVAIYAVGTPEPISPDKGRYLNFEGDDTIYGPLASKVIHPPPPNVSEAFYWSSNTTDAGSYKGHDFVDEYLAAFGDRITSEIKSELFILRPTYASDTLTECFTAPADTVKEKTASVGLAVVDFYASSLVGIAQEGGGEVAFALGAGGKALGAMGDFFGGIAGIFAPASPDPNKARAANDAGVALLNALNLTSIDAKTADQLQRDAQNKNNDSLGGAAILAFEPDQPAPAGEVLGSSTEGAGGASSSPPTVFVPDPSTVHQNAPAFGGPDAEPDADAPAVDDNASTTPDNNASSSPPLLAPPTISFSNWAVSDEARLCDVPPRFVDIAWNAPGATHYDLYTQDVASQIANLYETTKDTGILSFSVPVGIYSMVPTNVIVVAHDDAGGVATTTTRLDTAIPDNTPPSLLADSMNPPIFAKGVPVNTSISIPFNEPLATGTVNTNSVRMGDAARTYNVDRTVSLSPDGKTITIIPTSPLAYSTGFNVQLMCTISDLYGNRLPNDIGIVLDPSSQYFTTETAPAAATSTP